MLLIKLSISLFGCPIRLILTPETLAAGYDSMHFQLALYNGRTLPPAVLGMRYYQYDLLITKLIR